MFLHVGIREHGDHYVRSHVAVPGWLASTIPSAAFKLRPGDRVSARSRNLLLPWITACAQDRPLQLPSVWPCVPADGNRLLHSDSAAGSGAAFLVRQQGRRAALFVYLGARNAAPVPLRPVDALRVDLLVPVRSYQPFT